MRRYLPLLSIAAGLALTGIGCAGGAASLDQNRHDQAGARRESFRIALEGCVQEESHGTNEFTLHNVFVKPPAEQPIGGETIEHGPIVAQGSWVRLNDQSEDLKQYLGKRIQVVGVVAGSGANTIGTSTQASDHQKYVRSSGDVYTNPDRNGTPASVAPVAANANGNAPLIAVEQIKQISDSCGKEG